MFDETMEKPVHNAWYIAAWSEEILDIPLARIILNNRLVIYRDCDGIARALEDRCCHRGAPLSKGEVVKEGIQCGYHGMVYSGDGICVKNPSEDGDPSKYSVKSFPIVEKQKAIWIWTGDQELADPEKIVNFPYHEDNDVWQFNFGHYQIAGNFMLMIDNLMDLTHLGYIHKSTIGGFPDNHDQASMEVKETINGVNLLRWTLNSEPPKSFINAAGFKGKIDRWTDMNYMAPSSVIQWGGALDVGVDAINNRDQEGGISLRLLHHASPETDSSCHYFFSVAARNVPTNSVGGINLFNDIVKAFEEDKVMSEAQQINLSIPNERDLYFRTHDKALVFARRVLREYREDELIAAAD